MTNDTRPTPPRSGSAADIVSKIQETLEYFADNTKWILWDITPAGGYPPVKVYIPDANKATAALALLPQLSAMLAGREKGE